VLLVEKEHSSSTPIFGLDSCCSFLIGGGGGWNGTALYPQTGRSLLEGATGGTSCNGSFSVFTPGGFGGGGGSVMSVQYLLSVHNSLKITTNFCTIYPTENVYQ
jgi:hypothetical protein